MLTHRDGGRPEAAGAEKEKMRRGRIRKRRGEQFADDNRVGYHKSWLEVGCVKSTRTIENTGICQSKSFLRIYVWDLFKMIVDIKRLKIYWGIFIGFILHFHCLKKCTQWQLFEFALEEVTPVYSLSCNNSTCW